MVTKAKKFIAGLCCLLLAVATICGVLLIGAPQRVYAAEKAEGELVLPSSYEQYLALDSPKDVSVSGQHIAIADGNRIYLCARAGGEYRVYTQGSEAATFGKIQLADDGYLYFTDASMRLWKLDPNGELAAEDVGYTLTNFLVADGKIYGTTATSLYALALDGSTDINYANPITPAELVLPAQLPMAYENGVLYYAVYNAVYAVDTATNTDMGTAFSLGGAALMQPTAIAIADGTMYYAHSSGLHLATSGGEIETLDGGAYTALSLTGSKLYCVKGRAVREYDLIANVFTSYEITSASGSVNRLHGAVQTARAGNLLVVSDAGNRRVLVYNIATGASSVLTAPAYIEDFTPNLVATDGNLIAVSSGSRIFTAVYGEEELTFQLATLDQSNVRGLACVYGSVYYVTSGALYGKLGEEPIVQEYGVPAHLTSDLYGDLFVVNEAGNAYRFSESEFLTLHSGTPLEDTMPANSTAVAADFEGNLYALAGDALYANGEKILSEIDGGDYVYLPSDEPALPRSFALGFEDGDVYFLFDDYIVKTTVDIPTLSAIDASGVYDELFASHDQSELFIDIPAGTIGVRTDLAAFRNENSVYFPYSLYYRTNEDMRGLLLAKKGDYVLVLLYEVTTTERVFTANLFHIAPEQRRIVDEEEYWLKEEAAMYLSSEVSSYYFPCLEPALAASRFARGTKVRVLGYVAAPERTYALVTYAKDVGTMSETEPFDLLMQRAAIEECIGYVPASYLTEVAPLPDDDGMFEPAWLKASKAGVLFTSQSGGELLITERTRAQFRDNGDGTYTCRVTVDGEVYTAIVAGNMIDRGESDALRISLIIILTVLAVGIVGGYFYLLPRKKSDL